MAEECPAWASGALEASWALFVGDCVQELNGNEMDSEVGLVAVVAAAVAVERECGGTDATWSRGWTVVGEDDVISRVGDCCVPCS